MSSIVNLNIKVGSEEVTISLADAKKLYEELKVLFGSNDKYWPSPVWAPPIAPLKFGENTPGLPNDVWYTTISSNKATANG